MLVTLSNSAKVYHKGVLKSYSTSSGLLLKCYVTDEYIENFDTEVRYPQERLIILAKFAQELCMETAGFGSIEDRKSFKALNAEDVTQFILGML